MRKCGLCFMLMAVLVLIFTGCSRHSSYGTPPPIKKFKWGMNVTEAFHVLGISEKDVTKTTLGTTSTFIGKGKIMISGRPAEYSLTFDYYFSEPVLIGITAKFKPEDIEDVEQNLTKQRGQGEYRYTAISKPLSVTWKDDTLEHNEQWKAKVEEIYRNNGVEVTDESLGKGINVGNKPITSCQLTLDKTSPLFGTILFNGQVAAMLNYPDRYTPKK